MNQLEKNEQIALLNILEQRFNQNIHRHLSLNWSDILAKLFKNPSKLWSLYQMESTGGEPDILCFEGSDKYSFYDCSPESPKGRRSLCYDQKGLDDRKDFKPENNVINLAEEMKIELLDETQYQFLQSFGDFDLKTSSWLKTPDSIRKLGGAIFGDKRYGHIFTYHNGASSYYAARGFRARLEI